MRERIKAHRKAGEAAQAEALLPEVDAAERLAREAVGKAQTIEDAVFDFIAFRRDYGSTWDTWRANGDPEAGAPGAAGPSDA